jgi:hypothetical protein
MRTKDMLVLYIYHPDMTVFMSCKDQLVQCMESLGTYEGYRSETDLHVLADDQACAYLCFTYEGLRLELYQSGPELKADMAALVNRAQALQLHLGEVRFDHVDRAGMMAAWDGLEVSP